MSAANSNTADSTLIVATQEMSSSGVMRYECAVESALEEGECEEVK